MNVLPEFSDRDLDASDNVAMGPPEKYEVEHESMYLMPHQLATGL